MTITLASVTSIRKRRVGRDDTLRVVFNLDKRQNSEQNTRARARNRVHATRGSVTLESHSQSSVGTSQRNLDAPVRGILSGLKF